MASLAQSEASPDKVMLEMLTDIQRDLQLLRRRDRERGPIASANSRAMALEIIVNRLVEFCEEEKINPNDLSLDDKGVQAALAELPPELLSIIDFETALNRVKRAGRKP